VGKVHCSNSVCGPLPQVIICAHAKGPNKCRAYEIKNGIRNGVQVRNYHADNGRFANNAFISDVRYKNQGISYCGVKAHHQNGKAEKRICALQDHARVLIM